MKFSPSQMAIKLTIIFLIVFSSFSIFSETQAEMSAGRADYSSQEFENIIPPNSCNCISFRFDDVQNGWLSYVQLEVIDKFKEKNIPLTIGIIGNLLDGYMATYVKQIANDDNPMIEISNHGWLHEDFSTLDKETQSQLMEKTNKRIFDFTGKSPKVFVPPFNVFNNDTLEAMKENNFTHFSSSVVKSEPPYTLVNSNLYNFPETSTTGTVSSLGLFEGISHTETLKDIQASQDLFGFSVVTLHPQDFSVIQNGSYSNQVNTNQIRELDLLLDEIQKSDLKIVFLSQINENVVEPFKNKETRSSKSESQTQIDPPSLELNSGPGDQSTQKIPEWARIIFVWYAENQVSEDELLNAIKYLVNEEIINLDS
jgi:peptidoglycan/xylan/chitin deacetylase (PgdA/CDA1 family)